MKWNEFPSWLKIESITFVFISFALIAFAFIITGISDIPAGATPDVPLGALLFFMLIPIGILLGIWIFSYSIFKNSWKFFLYGEGILLFIWLILWLID